MATNILTDLTIRGVKLGDPRDRMHDGDGLYLKLLKRGRLRTFRFDYKFNGVAQTISLGVYPVSWVFQPNDPVTINPSNKDYLALVSIEEDRFFQGYFVKAVDVMKIYEAPKKEGLDKKVIYESTLLQ